MSIRTLCLLVAGLVAAGGAHAQSLGKPAEFYFDADPSTTRPVVAIKETGDAAVQMNDAPSAGAQQMVSLWQHGLVGIRGLRFVNWQRRRSGAVAVLRSVAY